MLRNANSPASPISSVSHRPSSKSKHIIPEGSTLVHPAAVVIGPRGAISLVLLVPLLFCVIYFYLLSDSRHFNTQLNGSLDFFANGSQARGGVRLIDPRNTNDRIYRYHHSNKKPPNRVMKGNNNNNNNNNSNDVNKWKQAESSKTFNKINTKE
ncbi:hypothetical protein RFI_06314 [Reticulomyxa filosa]|uniref:Uncharacterized protein n=1 Tax=Reticulomyxa filosa TaxID=46433 RepID=X6NZT0_RETFI|nr:hypothetical protein RFI_06314 [Reticulomyxa filosa]|eukprot:ETO30807.1 hypothetical protein RFI_06314 [Reticulomyxa filosa]